MNGTVTGNVYGGGLNGAMQGTGVCSVTVQGGVIRGNLYGGGSSGSLAGPSQVVVRGGEVRGNVYGGGDQGSVAGGCTVEITGGTVGGGVYGGGDQGAVSGGASVALSGGTVSGNVFGGSRGVENTPETGAVTGNTSVSITGGVLGSYSGTAGETFDQTTGNVYGGGEFARVKAGAGTASEGNSAVTVDVHEDTEVHPAVGGSVYGGGSRADVEKKSTVRLKAGRVGGSIYGAGYGASSVSESTEVTVEGGSVGNHVFGGGAEGLVETTASVTVSGGTMRSVFAAGEGKEETGVDTGRVSGSASVSVTGGTIAGGLYGGGYLGLVGTGSSVLAETPQTSAHTEVILSGGTVDYVFGGGSGSGSDPTFGAVFGTAGVTVTGGTVTGSVYGGSNYAYVTGDTRVSLKGASVGGSVYGGGNLNRSPEEGFDNASFLVLGNSSLTLDGTGGLTVGGSVFGSGNLTRVQGTRELTVKNLTASFCSIQRTTRTRLEASKITLTGADDITDDQGTKAFSITKVDDLQLMSSTLCLEAEARELGALGNYDGSGEASSAVSYRSTLQMAPGLLLQLMPSSEAGGAGNYGSVSGVLWLEMSGEVSGGRGVRIEAAETSPIGDGAADTGVFQKKETPANQGLEMISGSVAGSHHFWRLGGSVLERKVTISAPRQDAGGQNTVSQAFQIPTASGSTVYKITGFRKVSGDFTLVKAEEGAGGSMTLPAFSEGQAAGDTFALRVGPTDSGNRGTWEMPADGSGELWGSYVLSSLPAGETAWNSGVEGIWKRGASYPTTVSTGTGAGNNAEFTFSLVYDASYDDFSGGELEFTFQEYRTGSSMGEEDLENTVVVLLTLEGEEGSAAQSAYVERGRKFDSLTNQDPVTLMGGGAVTASFTTVYYPASAGSGNMFLCLCSGSDGTPAAFPEGTRIVLGDIGTAAHSYYFYRTGAGEQRIALSGFTRTGTSGSVVYPGPADITSRITEKLLFAVDFSNVDSAALLGLGDYSLRLIHSPDSDLSAAAPAAFSIVAGQAHELVFSGDASATTHTRLGVTLEPRIAEADTRYADGAGIRLTLTDSAGEPVSFPSKIQVGGAAESVLRDPDGTVSFVLPVSGSSSVVLDFSAVPETMLASGSYQVHAVLRPRTGLQVDLNHGGPDASPEPVAFTLKREVRSGRAVSAQLKDETQRLADVSAGDALLEFTVAAQTEEGDRLEAWMFRKTGTTPEASSYMRLPAGDGWCTVGALSGGTAEALLTVPQGTESGTYRVVFRVTDAGGSVLAEEPYNFIVK